MISFTLSTTTGGSSIVYDEIGESVTLNYSEPFENIKVGDIIVFDPNLDEVTKAMQEGLMASTSILID
jgi:hypothetical protein